MILPLPGFAPEGPEKWKAERLDLSSTLSNELRARVVDYLDSCPVAVPWMGYTRDELGDRFYVPAGAAIKTDGAYYWRVDAARYIEEYGILIPEAAIDHFARSGWSPPNLDDATLIAIESEIDRITGWG